MTATRVTAALVLVLGLAACGRAHERTSEALAGQALAAAAATDASIAGPGPGPATPPPRLPAVPVPLPSDFPRDVVLPEDYTVVSVTRMGAAHTVVLRSDEALPALREQFQSGQAKRGWKETVSMLDGEGAMLGFRKGDRGVVVNLRVDLEGQTVVSLSLQPAA